MLERIKNLFHKKTEEVELSVSEKIDLLFDELNEDIILLQLGDDLADFGKLLCDIIQLLREEIKNECGFIIPQVRVQNNTFIQENEFVIYILGDKAENGYLVPNEKGIREEFYDTFKTVMYDKMNVIFTNEVTERYIDTAQRHNGWLIWNITTRLSVPEIKIILSDIIDSGKSINNIGYIFEKIGEEILLNGGYQDCFKKHNPHEIARQITKIL